MKHPQIRANLTVSQVMDRWPQTIPVFFRHRMACVGCPMAPYGTLVDAAAVYGLGLDVFLSEIEQSITQPPRTRLNGINDGSAT